MKKLSKRMELLSSKIEDRIYTAQEALTIVKENANAKFERRPTNVQNMVLRIGYTMVENVSTL